MSNQLCLIISPSLGSILTFAPSVIAVVCFAAVLWGLRKTRHTNQNTLAVTIELEGELSAISRDLDTCSRQNADQARRLAWLESRVRSTSLKAPEPTAITNTMHAKPSITERRHRVLSLRKRGMEAEAIANTLGVPHGEVELIIGLSNAA